MADEQTHKMPQYPFEQSTTATQRSPFGYTHQQWCICFSKSIERNTLDFCANSTLPHATATTIFHILFDDMFVIIFLFAFVYCWYLHVMLHLHANATILSYTVVSSPMLYNWKNHDWFICLWHNDGRDSTFSMYFIFYLLSFLALIENEQCQAFEYFCQWCKWKRLVGRTNDLVSGVNSYLSSSSYSVMDKHWRRQDNWQWYFIHSFLEMSTHYIQKGFVTPLSVCSLLFCLSSEHIINWML